MHLPEELICLILGNSHWRGPAQTLLFRRITLKAAAAFAKFADTASNKALLSHNLGRADLCLVSTLLYELSINAQLFSLGEDISSISAIVHAASISIRSLRLMECSVHSPILYELIGLFPSVEFLTLGVEIAAAPPPWTPAIQLYELMLHRTPPSDLLQWLLSSSGTSLRILEMRDLPSARTSSLRFMRYNTYSAAILHQCTNLGGSLEHFALLIQTYTAHVDLEPVFKAVESLPCLKIVTFAICDAKGVSLHTTLRKYWISLCSWTILSRRHEFPRRLSVSNFYSMS
ncbi:hypothetical protein B0H14DRAFT_2739306 [Mycena olivaceomarginata]|nr:hypothetical protein B0H14DRAFT_2739306 [Mycena olivaceomarginata]